MTEYRGVCARVSLSVWIGLMNVPGTGFKKIVLTVVIIDSQIYNGLSTKEVYFLLRYLYRAEDRKMRWLFSPVTLGPLLTEDQQTSVCGHQSCMVVIPLQTVGKTMEEPVEDVVRGRPGSSIVAAHITLSRIVFLSHNNCNAVWEM